MFLDSWWASHPVEVVVAGLLFNKRTVIWHALKELPEGLQGIRRMERLRTLAKLEKLQRDANYGWRYVLESTASLCVSMAVAGLVIFPMSLVLDRVPRGQSLTLPQVTVRSWVLEQEGLFAVTYVFLIVTMVALNAYVSSRSLRSPRKRAGELRRRLGDLGERDERVLREFEAE